MGNNILIVSTMPESAGIGGVTIHTERLLKWLEIENYPVDFCDYKKESAIEIIRKIAKHKIIHLHCSNPILRIIQILICIILRKKTIFTIHGNLGRFSAFKNLLDKIVVKLSTVPIVINQESYEKAKQWNKSAVLMSAFIKPYEIGKIPVNIKNYISQKRSIGKTILSTNASTFIFDKNGNEVYGIDFIIEYFRNKSDFILVISDPSKEYSKRHENQVFDNIKFITEPHSFYAVILESDIVIRATSTDGDSISIREALYANKKVIATDCVPRPENVIKFKYRNTDSLEAAIQEALNTKDITTSCSDTIKDIINLYRNLDKKRYLSAILK